MFRTDLDRFEYQVSLFEDMVKEFQKNPSIDQGVLDDMLRTCKVNIAPQVSTMIQVISEQNPSANLETLFGLIDRVNLVAEKYTSLKTGKPVSKPKQLTTPQKSSNPFEDEEIVSSLWPKQAQPFVANFDDDDIL